MITIISRQADFTRPHPSAGPTPFGFAADKRNTLFVSEAGPGGGSTYRY